MSDKKFYVYMLATGRNGTFYVGLTSNLPRRIQEHRDGCADGFTKKYGISRLVYYEIFEDAENAARRERRLKKWTRSWKMQAIEASNPDWNDLYDTFTA